MSPYPGGKHGPGHYIAADGGVQGMVSVGAALAPPTSGQQVPSPPGLTPGGGDRLFVWGAPFSAPVVDGTWTQLATAPATFDIFTKIAAGDATDDAFHGGGAVGGWEIMIMWAFLDDGSIGIGVWDFNALSTLRNTMRTVFDVLSLASFGANLSLSFYAGMRTIPNNNLGAVNSMSDVQFSPPNGNNILLRSSLGTAPPFASETSFYHAISWSFQAVPAVFPAGNAWGGAQAGTNATTQNRGWRYDHD